MPVSRSPDWEFLLRPGPSLQHRWDGTDFEWNDTHGAGRGVAAPVPPTVSDPAWLSPEERHLIALQRSHGFSTFACAHYSACSAGRSTADQHLRNWTSMALLQAGLSPEQPSAQLSGAPGSPLEQPLERCLEAFL